jgi:peptide/nickel transport system substrate-binding protein
MDSRFTFKDFVFAVLFVVVIGAVIWASYQYSYQEARLNDVKLQLQRMEDREKQQFGALAEIRNALTNGVRVSDGGSSTRKGPGESPETAGRIRRKNPDGSQYVYYPDIPQSPRHPELKPDYATGDWLVQNIGMEPEKIAPFITNDFGSMIVQGPVLEGLVGRNPETLEFEPTLADSYEISADGLKFKFHLRPKVCFSDGSPITADDVLFSYNTVTNKEVDAAPLRAYYDKVKGCRKIDDQTVEFEMSEPYFLAMEFIGGLSIIPEHVYKFAKGEDFNRMGGTLVGSGPYVLQNWDRGKRITMARNEKYWGDRPTYDKIIYLFIGNPQAQLQSFQNGDLDYMGQPIAPDPEQYIKMTADPEFMKKSIAYKYSTPSELYICLGYNCDRPLFKDKQTRQALTMLIDRKAIISNMLHGFGSEMTGPFTKQSKQNDPTIALIPYDVEGAKKKLAEAGWKAGADGVLARDGVKFEFNLSLRTNVPIRERIATYIQQQFQQAGIRVRLTPYESSVLLENLNKREFDAVLAGWGGGGIESDPKQIWSSENIENRGSNHVAFRNKEADALIEQARKTLDVPKRMELWHQFERIVYDEQPYTWLYAEQDCAFINGRFRNTEPYPGGLAELDWYVPAALQKYR